MPTQKEIADFYAANANNPAAIQAVLAAEVQIRQASGSRKEY